MPHELPDRLITELIRIDGNREGDSIAMLLGALPEVSNGEFVRLGPDAWRKVGEALDHESLAALVRTLTWLESSDRRIAGGSVSPVIWLYRILHSRGGDRDYSVADWVLGNTRNPYLPFGTWNYQARSIAEYREAKAAANAYRQERLREEERRQQEARKRKAEDATRKLFGALRRGDTKAVAALLAKGANPWEIGPEGKSAADYARELGRNHMLSNVDPQR